MPILVHCLELQPKMRLAEPFVWRGRTMLPGGKVLTLDDLDSLRHRYPEVTLKIGDPVLDAMVSFEDDSRDLEVANNAQSQISKTMTDVQDRFSNRTSIDAMNFQAMREAAASVIDYIRSSPVSAALLRRQSTSGNYLGDHSGSVFYLCIVLGSAIRTYVMEERRRQTSAGMLHSGVAMDLLPLGLGAMFMDIAMYTMPQVFTPDYTLTSDDRKLIRQHPVAGAEMLPDSLPAGVKMVVRSHHENFDGTGYPDAIPGKKLHVFTRIVRICDAYAAVTSNRVYRAAKSPARALWEMRFGPTSRCYDPVLMKMFHSLIQPFPIGAKLKLSDGRWGVVVRYNKQNPFRPQIIVAFDESGTLIEKAKLTPAFRIGEGDQPDLRLASFGAEDLSYLSDATLTEEPAMPSWEDMTTPLSASYP